MINCCEQSIALICRRSAPAFRLQLLKDAGRAEPTPFRQIWMSLTVQVKSGSSVAVDQSSGKFVVYRTDTNPAK
jgi:hypothetical protein